MAAQEVLDDLQHLRREERRAAVVGPYGITPGQRVEKFFAKGGGYSPCPRGRVRIKASTCRFQKRHSWP